MEKLTQAQTAKLALDAANLAKANKAKLEAQKNLNPSGPTSEDKAKAKQAKKEAKAREEEAKAEAESSKPKPDNDGFVNPFESGLSYDDFIKLIPENESIEEYCSGKIEKNQISWLVSEIKSHLSNK